MLSTVMIFSSQSDHPISFVFSVVIHCEIIDAASLDLDAPSRRLCLSYHIARSYPPLSLALHAVSTPHPACHIFAATAPPTHNSTPPSYLASQSSDFPNPLTNTQYYTHQALPSAPIYHGSAGRTISASHPTPASAHAPPTPRRPQYRRIPSLNT